MRQAKFWNALWDECQYTGVIWEGTAGVAKVNSSKMSAKLLLELAVYS